MNDENHLIDTYSRAEAIEDGQLIPIPDELLADAGYHPWIPVAITASAWAEAVAWTGTDTERTGAPQDETGRLYDVVMCARGAATRPPQDLDEDPAAFTVYRVARDARPGEDGDIEPVPLRLVLLFGYDEDDRPVFTICLPGDE